LVMSGLLNMGPQDEALLALGLGLLNSKGSFGNALGQSGMQAMQTLNQAKEREQRARQQAQQEEMQRMQVEQMRRQATLDAMTPTMRKPDFMDNRDVGLPGEAQPSPDLGGLAQQYMMAPGGLSRGLQLQEAIKKQRIPPTISKPGDIARDDSGAVLWSNPDKPEKMDPNKPFMVVDGKIVPNPAYQEYAKDVARAGATSVSYGTGATPMQMPNGDVSLVQLSGKPGVPPQIVKDPATGKPMRPPPQDRDVKLPAELQRMQIAGDAMGSLLNDYEALLKKHNPRDPMVQANPVIRAQIQSVKRNLELQFKELQALGALAGPDIEIMREALADPFSIQGAFFGRGGLLAQVDAARKLITQRSDAVLKSQGKPASAPAADANDPLGLRK
jgi:hypothetical protein